MNSFFFTVVFFFCLAFFVLFYDKKNRAKCTVAGTLFSIWAILFSFYVELLLFTGLDE